VSSTNALAVFKIFSLWSEKVSFSFSAWRVPAVAKSIVVSKSPIIPDTVLAALTQAWVPRVPVDDNLCNIY